MTEATTITVRAGSFCPPVTFQRTFWKGSLEAQVKEVLETWTSITGLNFTKMGHTAGEETLDGEQWVVLTVTHPLDNRSDVTIFWQK